MNKELSIRDEMAPTLNLLGNTFKEAMEVANCLAKSDLIPVHFQKKPENIFIALQMAARQNLDPFLVMQSIYVVHGRPGFEGKFLIALANRAGWNLRFKTEENSRGEVVSCQAYSEKDGIKVFGPKITWEMVQAEGWDKPKGSMPSKWVTLRSLMFTYRAGAWFVNTVCPELRLGLPTTEELEDVSPLSITTVPETQPDITPEPEASSHPQPNFDTLWSDYYHGKPDNYLTHIQNYLEAAAAHNKTTVDDIKEKAAARWPEFVKTFEKWVKKQTKTKDETPQSPPAPETPQPDKTTTAIQTNGATAISGPVRAITDDQIDRIESLCKAKNMPLADALIAECLPKDLIELDYDSAASLIEKLAAL